MTHEEIVKTLNVYGIPQTAGAMGFAEVVTKAERERCAKVCEDSVVDHGGALECTLTPFELAKKIRAGTDA